MFNEWHASSTSKKIKAVIEANAKAGKYKTSCAAYGYIKADDDAHTPIIDPEAAEVVRRIFTLRSQGVTPRHIADNLNAEHIPIPSDYFYQKQGKVNPKFTRHLWSQSTIRQILIDPIYLGKLVQLRRTSISYKNHKTIQKNAEDRVVVENNHEPIISQELWDRCREVDKSVSQGKRTKKGVMAPLSGFLYCDACGSKMRQHNGSKGEKPAYTCGLHSRCGGNICSTHYIKRYLIEATVLADIQAKSRMVLYEADAKEKFLAYKSKQNATRSAEEKKRETAVRNRLDELDKLIQRIYEDKILGRVPEDVCIGLLEKYSAEKKSLSVKYEAILEREKAIKQDEADVDEFISRLKKYAGAEELTREMCLALISYVTVDESAKDRTNPRKIHIYYKFLDRELTDKYNALV